MPADETLHERDPVPSDDAGKPDAPRPVSSSFAGALWRAMRTADPPMDPDDLLLIASPLPGRDVAQLLMAQRLPSAGEVAHLAEALGLALDDLLGCQRVANRDGDRARRGPWGRGRGLVAMKLRVPPEVRTALRLRKATSGRDIGELMVGILEEALAEELAVVRECGGE